MLRQLIEERCPHLRHRVDDLLVRYRRSWAKYYVELKERYGAPQNHARIKICYSVATPATGYRPGHKYSYVPSQMSNADLGEACRKCGRQTIPRHYGNECPFGEASAATAPKRKRGGDEEGSVPSHPNRVGSAPTGSAKRRKTAPEDEEGSVPSRPKPSRKPSPPPWRDQSASSSSWCPWRSQVQSGPRPSGQP